MMRSAAWSMTESSGQPLGTASAAMGNASSAPCSAAMSMNAATGVPVPR